MKPSVLVKTLLGLTVTDKEEGESVPKAPKVALIVEDNPDDAAFVAHLLRQERWHCHVESNPTDADAWLRNNACDVIIMDLSFQGDRDGHSYARELSIRPATEHIPIIFNTGFSADLMAKERGDCVIFLGKPPSLEGIRRVLKVANGNGNCKKAPKVQIVVGTWLFWWIGVAVGHGLGRGWLIELIKLLIK